MMKQWTAATIFVLIAAVWCAIIIAEKDDDPTALVYRYIVLGSEQSGDSKVLIKELEASSAVIKSEIPELQAFVIETTDPDFDSKKLTGVTTIVPDLTVALDVQDELGGVIDEYEEVSPSYNPGTEKKPPFDFFQWPLTTVKAREAWAKGHRGKLDSGLPVRVAVLDSGFYTQHVELQGKIDEESSKGFVDTEPGIEYDASRSNGTRSTGTHRAGIIAAADDESGTIGIAPDAELILIKVFKDDYSSTSHVSLYSAGIVHAANQGADVIDLGCINGPFWFQGNGRVGEISQPVSKKIAKNFRAVLNKAINYAHAMGSIVIAHSGQMGINLNDPENRNMVPFPSLNSHVITISSVGTRGWAKNYPANTYLAEAKELEKDPDSNVGSYIDFAAPGGIYKSNEIDRCTVLGIDRTCTWFDMVLSPSTKAPDSYNWVAGPNMATAVASGVAALIISENGSRMKPAHVKRELRARAFNPDEPEIFGFGIVRSVVEPEE